MLFGGCHCGTWSECSKCGSVMVHYLPHRQTWNIKIFIKKDKVYISYIPVSTCKYIHCIDLYNNYHWTQQQQQIKAWYYVKSSSYMYSYTNTAHPTTDSLLLLNTFVCYVMTFAIGQMRKVALKCSRHQ